MSFQDPKSKKSIPSGQRKWEPYKTPVVQAAEAGERRRRQENAKSILLGETDKARAIANAKYYLKDGLLSLQDITDLGLEKSWLDAIKKESGY